MAYKDPNGAKAYYIANKEKIKARNKLYRETPERMEMARIRVAKYRSNPKNKDKIKARRKAFNQRPETKAYRKAHYQDNKERRIPFVKAYYLANADKIKARTKAYAKVRKKSDPLFKMRSNIAIRICMSLKENGYTKKSRTHQILGCDYEFFKQYIESQFTKGMAWENHGKWHFDHIYPVALAKTEEELIRLNHYTNFQPLWASDNLSKGAKILPIQLKVA